MSPHGNETRETRQDLISKLLLKTLIYILTFKNLNLYKMITDEQKQWMLKAILNSKDLIVFQHEEETLSMMYWKYTIDKDIEPDELKDDLRFLENLAN